MKNQTIVISAMAIMSLASCYSDIDLEKYREEQRVVLNCIANSDTTIMADVSSTWFFTEGYPSDDIEGLDIDISINGTHKGKMTYDGDKYQSSIRPKAGERIAISTTIEGKTISAEDVMPEKTTISSIDITHKHTNGMEEVFTYEIHFNNDASACRYYFAKIGAVDYISQVGTLDYSADPAFRLTSERINKTFASLKLEGQNGMPFSNEAMQEGDCCIRITEKGDYTYYNMGDNAQLRKVTLYSISEAYYKYLISVLSNDSESSWQGGLTDIGLSEPVRIFSNINGGCGIFGCLHSDKKIVKLPNIRE
ncbi:MAG: DUF4249 domain-containing protein [Prevotella sp.]